MRVENKYVIVLREMIMSGQTQDLINYEYRILDCIPITRHILQRAALFSI